MGLSKPFYDCSTWQRSQLAIVILWFTVSECCSTGIHTTFKRPNCTLSGGSWKLQNMKYANGYKNSRTVQGVFLFSAHTRFLNAMKLLLKLNWQQGKTVGRKIGGVILQLQCLNQVPSTSLHNLFASHFVGGWDPARWGGVIRTALSNRFQQWYVLAPAAVWTCASFISYRPHRNHCDFAWLPSKKAKKPNGSFETCQ